VTQYLARSLTHESAIPTLCLKSLNEAERGDRTHHLQCGYRPQPSVRGNPVIKQWNEMLDGRSSDTHQVKQGRLVKVMASRSQKAHAPSYLLLEGADPSAADIRELKQSPSQVLYAPIVIVEDLEHNVHAKTFQPGEDDLNVRPRGDDLLEDEKGVDLLPSLVEFGCLREQGAVLVLRKSRWSFLGGGSRLLDLQRLRT
jgi:hypothetical protein